MQDGHRTDETYRRYRPAFNHISDGSDKPSSYTRWPAVATAEQHGQRENEWLSRQLQATNARQDDVTELVEFVKEERSLRREQAEAD